MELVSTVASKCTTDFNNHQFCIRKKYKIINCNFYINLVGTLTRKVVGTTKKVVLMSTGW